MANYDVRQTASTFRLYVDFVLKKIQRYFNDQKALARAPRAAPFFSRDEAKQTKATHSGVRQ